MGRVQMEQGQLDAALETYRIATRITPHNVARLQKQGLLAFYLGEAAEATLALERSVRLGADSKAFDCQSLMLLALMHFDRRDHRALARNHDLLLARFEKHPEDARLGRFVTSSNVFQSLVARQVGPCVAHVRALAAASEANDFDFESAGNLLAVLARLGRSEIQLPDSDAWASRVARRFCGTMAATELLCKVVASHAPLVDLVRAGHAHIGALAEQAMAHNRSGSPGTALQGLLAAAAETRSPKLLDLAAKLLARHAASLPEAPALAESLTALRARFAPVLHRQSGA
jgi:tetratricopeptide (TPR) repeat protein